MSGWTSCAPALAGLDGRARSRLEALAPMRLARGTVLFRAGERAQGFALVLSGRIEVMLPGPEGRGLLLYAVAPGQSCIQTTLGLMGGEAYAGEGVVAAESELVAIPRPLFLSLLEEAPGFRAFVFQAFGQRMREMVRLLSMLAFRRLESRLAELLLARAEAGVVAATHQEMASALGTAREVVSRRLDGFAREGWIETGRGVVRILDAGALAALAEEAL